MSKLWDDLKKNMKDWGSVAVEKAEEVSKIAVAKTEEITKISKHKIDIHQLQKKREKTFGKLGQFVVQQAKEDNMVNFTGNTEFFTFVQKLDEITKLIENEDGEIQKIKTEYNLKESDIISAAEVEEGKTDTSVAIEEEVVEEQEQS